MENLTNKKEELRQMFIGVKIYTLQNQMVKDFL
jgi:hypothetical protein